MHKEDAVQRVMQLADELKAKFFADQKSQIVNSLKSTDPSTAWIVYTTAENFGFGGGKRARVKLTVVLAHLAEKGVELDMDVNEVPVHPSSKRAQCNLDGYVEHGAFSNHELASVFASYIDGAELPKEVPINDIKSKMDQFRELILDGKKPYNVLFQHGELVEISGYKSPYELNISSIDQLSFETTYGSMYGTIWAWDFNDAIRAGRELWDRMLRGDNS